MYSQMFLSEEGRIIRIGEKDVMTEVGDMVRERFEDVMLRRWRRKPRVEEGRWKLEEISNSPLETSDSI